MTKLLAALILTAAACGGSKPAAKAGPPSGDPPATTAAGGCPTPTWSCTIQGMGCFEGGDDFKAAMEKDCTSGGGTAGTKCDPAGTKGKCQVDQPGKLTPSFAGCASVWMTSDDGQAKCEKFKGTWTPS